MFEAAFFALDLMLDPERILWLLLGVLVGLMVGLLPGLGGTVGMSILLPFIFGMDPYSGVALLIGMAAVTHTSDTFPSVLIGVPGSGGSQATIMDGYPLAQQGQAARALSAAFFASMIGGLIGAVVLFSVLSVARPLVLAMGSPELFMLTMLGLCTVGILSRGSAVAGIITALFGLLLGVVGAAVGAAQYRYTFGELYLYDGIPLAVLALGLFALPELIDLVSERRAIAKVPAVTGGRMQGLRDVVRHRWLVLRSGVLGSAVGIIPGLGGNAVDWILYGVTKQSYSDTENFGHGDIRGVIGPETGNNAKDGGALVPTLVFGIPGSGTTAILLGGMTVLGVQAGPAMLDRHLGVTLSMIWTLAFANVLATIACLGLAGWVAKLTTIPASRLMPFLLVVMVLAAYQSTRHWGDIIAFVVIGMFGWLFKQLGWPRAPALIGFVLADASERYLHISMSRYGFEWLLRPGVMIIGLLTLLLLGGGLVRKTGKAIESAEQKVGESE